MQREPPRFGVAAIAGGDEIPADHEEHKDADEAEHALVPAEPDKRFAGLAKISSGTLNHPACCADECAHTDGVRHEQDQLLQSRMIHLIL